MSTEQKKNHVIFITARSQILAISAANNERGRPPVKNSAIDVNKHAAHISDILPSRLLYFNTRKTRMHC